MLKVFLTFFLLSLTSRVEDEVNEGRQSSSPELLVSADNLNLGAEGIIPNFFKQLKYFSKNWTNLPVSFILSSSYLNLSSVICPWTNFQALSLYNKDNLFTWIFKSCILLKQVRETFNVFLLSSIIAIISFFKRYVPLTNTIFIFSTSKYTSSVINQTLRTDEARVSHVC